jgi:hypothetical protein
MPDLSLIHALATVSIELTTIYFHSLEIFIIQIGEMAFCISKFIVINSNYFQNVRKGECFLDDFEALVCEIYVRSLLCGRAMSFFVRHCQNFRIFDFHFE